MGKIVSLSTLASGGIDEQFNLAMRDVLSNIADLNTDPKKKREITVTVSMTGNELRNLSDVSIEVKTSLAPSKAVETSLIIGFNENGVTGSELQSGAVGQTFIDKEGDIADDKGEKIVRIERAENAVKFN